MLTAPPLVDVIIDGGDAVSLSERRKAFPTKNLPVHGNYLKPHRMLVKGLLCHQSGRFQVIGLYTTGYPRGDQRATTRFLGPEAA